MPTMNGSAVSSTGQKLPDAALATAPKTSLDGAIISNGNLYCPMTPRPLLELGPLARDAGPEDIAAHDVRTAETARYKLGRLTAD